MQLQFHIHGGNAYGAATAMCNNVVRTDPHHSSPHIASFIFAGAVALIIWGVCFIRRRSELVAQAHDRVVPVDSAVHDGIHLYVRQTFNTMRKKNISCIPR